MNRTYRELRAGFAATTRFDAPVVAAAPFRGMVENELEQLKERLLWRELQRADSVEANVLLRRAANDAVALAWLTPYPLLLLPELFQEKAWEMQLKARRQARIREQTEKFTVLTE
jgi:hypothetical protein